MAEVTVIAAPDARARAERSVRLAGGTASEVIDWPDATGWLDDAPLAKVLLVEAEKVDAATLAAVLPRIDAWARENAASVVVAMELAQVDLVTALLSGPRVQWLCDAGEGERVAALALASASVAGGLQDTARGAGVVCK